jgi:hypothetical protein
MHNDCFDSSLSLCSDLLVKALPVRAYKSQVLPESLSSVRPHPTDLQGDTIGKVDDRHQAPEVNSVGIERVQIFPRSIPAQSIARLARTLEFSALTLG